MAAIGLTLPVAAAEAATKRPRKTAVKHVAHTAAHPTRTSRLRRAPKSAQS